MMKRALQQVIIGACLLSSTEAIYYDLEEEQYNDVGFIGMALWIGCICRSMAIYLHIPLCISHVGVFTVGFIISFLNFHDYINFKMINSLASYNEHAFCMLIIPVILINLSLRIDFYLYQRKPLQMILLASLNYFNQFALIAITLFLLNLALMNIPSAQDVPVFIAFTSVVLSTKETEAVMKLTKHCTQDLRLVNVMLHCEELVSVLLSTHLYQVFRATLGSTGEIGSEFQLSAVVFGPFVGFCAGATGYLGLSAIITLARHDFYMQICFLTGIIYFIYALFYAFLGSGGEIAVAMIIILMVGDLSNKNKSKVKQLIEHWEIVDYITNWIVFQLVGTIVARNSVPTLVLMFLAACICYLVIVVSRCLCWLLIFGTIITGTIFKRASDVLVATLGTYNTGTPLVLAALVDRKLTTVQILPIVSFVVILSLLVQLLPFQWYLRRLGYYRLDTEDIIHMNSLWQKIYQYRNRAVQYFSQSELTRGANTSFLKKFLLFGTPEHTSDTGLINYDLHNEKQLNSLKDDQDFRSFGNRILSIQLNLFKQRYKDGLLMMTAYKTLRDEIINARCRKLKILEIKYIARDWHRLGMFFQWKNFMLRIKEFWPLYLGQKRNLQYRSQAIFYNVLSHPLYQFIMTLIILCDAIAIHYLLKEYYHPNEFLSARVMHELIFFNGFTHTLCNLEFVMEIYVFGKDDFFSKKTRILFFSHQCVLRTYEGFLFLTDPQFPNITSASDVVIYLKMIELLEFWRLFTIFPIISHTITNWVTSHAISELSKRTDICNALILSYDLLINEHVKSIKTNANKLKQFKEQIEYNRLQAIKHLGDLKRVNPNVSVTMQTRHCVRAILIEMYKVFIEEKLTGKYSEQELKCFEDEFKKMNTMADEIKLLKPEPVIGFLQKIKWIRKNFIQLFERNAIFRHFDYGKYIIERGTDPSGLYIIVSGLVKLEYRPTDSTLMRLVVHGELPNCDHLATLEFQRPHDLILSRGTLLGELGIVTGRRFDMNVKCETFVERWEGERLSGFIERGVSIVLSPGAPLQLTYFLAEVILIEGVLLDTCAKVAYYAPYRIDIKTVRHLFVGINVRKDIDVNTRIYVIPKETAKKEDFLVEGMNTYRGEYRYDYEEVRRIVDMEAERFKKYQDENLLSAIRREDSSLIDIQASSCLLSCPEEEEEEVTPSPKEEMRKTRKEEIFHEMLTEKSEPQLQTLPVPPLPSTEVLVLLTDERRFKEDVSLETSSSEEGLRVLSTIAAKTDDNQPEMNLTETKDISYLHLLDISVSYTETAQEQPSMPNLNPTPSTSFQIPGLSGISVQSLHSDGSSMEDYKEEVSSNDSEFDMESSEFSKEFRESIHSREYSKLEQEYYDGIARSFPVCEPVEEKSLADWRIALLPKEFYKTKFVQTNLRMRKSNLLNVMFEQSLNSLFSDTILHQPAQRFSTPVKRILKSDSESVVGVRLRKYKNLLERDYQFREKYEDVYRERDKQNVEVVGEKIFTKTKIMKNLIKRCRSTGSPYSIKRAPVHLTFKHLGQETPEEFRSKYDIVAENRFGESLSSSSESQVYRKRKKGMVRKKRRLHQRLVRIKHRNRCPFFSGKTFKNKIADLVPKLFKTVMWEDFAEVLSPQHYGIVRAREAYRFMAPPELYSVLAAATFPRLPTPEDSYLKLKKDHRVYWSSSTSSS
ncbi:sperm-specific sodium:proton exchanger-like isoform X3 [Rhodnius prolixus]|uniref:sperm-specific sodium:proton exchanger-like isoform X3 n=1 Tax=Rhodnius prolixus TaxID=13249 RepID=UPI003D18A942